MHWGSRCYHRHGGRCSGRHRGDASRRRGLTRSRCIWILLDSRCRHFSRSRCFSSPPGRQFFNASASWILRVLQGFLGVCLVGVEASLVRLGEIVVKEKEEIQFQGRNDADSNAVHVLRRARFHSGRFSSLYHYHQRRSASFHDLKTLGTTYTIPRCTFSVVHQPIDQRGAEFEGESWCVCLPSQDGLCVELYHVYIKGVCQFYLRGQCKFGNSCRNDHPANPQQGGGFGGAHTAE